MSLLADGSTLSKMPGKRPLDHGGCQYRAFPPNFKRPKVDALRQFPSHCGALAPLITPRPCKGVSGVVATGNSKVGEEGAVVPFKPSGISVPSDVKSESTKPIVSSHDNVETLEQGMTVDHGEQGLPKTCNEPKLTNVPENLTQAKPVNNLDIFKFLSQPLPLVRKYPPPKIRKGVPVSRDFPPGCGRPNYAPKSKVLANKSSVEHRSLVETTRIDMKLIRGQIQDGHAFERKLEGNALKEMADEVQGKSSELIGSETRKQIQGGTSSEYIMKQDKDRVETSSVSPSEIKLLPPEPVCQTVSIEIKQGNNLVGRTAKEPEEYFEDRGAEDGSGMVMWSQGAQYVDMKPSCGDWAIVKWEGERVSNCEPAEVTYRYKSHNHEVNDAIKTNSVLLQKEDITEASKQNYTKEKSLIVNVEADNRCEVTLFDDKENHEHILVAEESSDLCIVPCDSIQAVVSRNKVKEALNLFEKIFTKLSEEHEAQSKGKGRAARQVHVEAAMLLKKQQKWVNTEPLLGAVPGVEVGDQFRFRVELVVIGLHNQFVAGIDFMEKGGNIFATSIVASGRYANDAESSGVLKYSGQGGNPTVGDKEPEDQKLERGNLALKNSMDARTLVRVIRGRQTSKASKILGTNSKRSLTYIYDGLYIVTNYWQERGRYGKLVFMFQLNRISGQPKLTRGIVSTLKKSKIHKVPSVVVDVSQGKEKMLIRVVNTVDDEKPLPFTYMTSVIYPEWYTRSMPIGCDCSNGCSDLEKCPCTIKNGGDIPFNCNGGIIKLKPLVYECGPSCKCPPSCKNRVSQHGIRYQLEVFKTESRGWGVRSRNYISSGSFVCEYAGELLQDKEAEQRIGNDEYLFDLGIDNDDNFPKDKALDDDGFTIDAAHYGNVGRFINHSCSPNLYAQNVLYDHDDKRIPHIMLFAAKSIPPLRELTYDYNYKLDQVRDINGHIKKKNCYCGSRECSGRMY